MAWVFLPRNASSWTQRDLTTIRVIYAVNSSALDYFKSRLHTPNIDVATETLYQRRNGTIATKTRRYWNFTIDINARETNEITRALISLNSLPENENEESMRWRTNLTEFLNCLYMILLREDELRECAFMQLFMGFTRIAFLYPELGEMYQRECYIKRNCVNGMPDFRFETLPKLKNPASASENPTETTRGHIPKLILVTEVKRYNGFNSTWNSGLTFKESFLTSSVKGQHGLELLLEINKSMFTSEAFGCICVGTYIIITHLRLPNNGMEDLERKGKLSNPGATIQYSRPYDFLKKEDREDILDFFILIGSIQSTRGPGDTSLT